MQEPTAVPGARHLSSVARLALMAGALALIALPAIKALLSRAGDRTLSRQAEAAIDKGLKDTFPASDPPGTHYFGIPENRV